MNKIRYIIIIFILLSLSNPINPFTCVFIAPPGSVNLIFTKGEPENSQPARGNKDKENPYTRVLKNILHGQAISEESKKRRQVLKRIGAEIKLYMQNILGSKKIKIAIIPIGSTLKGYAAKSSDIEYQIIILEGLSSEDIG